ncbi:MAG: hypothetical protein MJ252_29560, partial [archaeon]|nr:hypothetical protein [archaeon]
IHNCSVCKAGTMKAEGLPLNCYFECPDGYFVSEGMCKKCFESCLHCDIKGDSIDNKCTVCNTKDYTEDTDYTDPSSSGLFNCFPKDSRPIDAIYKHYWYINQSDTSH